MAKILITGCSGFLAGYLIDLLQTQKNTVFGLTEVADFKSSNYKVFNIDIREKDKVFAVLNDVKPDLTYHLAAVSSVGMSWKNQKLTYEVNFIGSSNIFEAVKEYSPGSRLVIISSAELYGIQKGTINEQSRVQIKNPYSLSKLAMEILADLFISAMDLDVIRIRSFNFTGPGQSANFVAPDFARQIAQIENGIKDAEIMVGNLSARRDFSDVRDIARYLVKIGQQGVKGEIYNLCSGKAYSIAEILDILLSYSIAKIKVVIDKKKFRPIDVPVLAGDNSFIKTRFNLEPRYSLEQTLLDLLNFEREKT